MELSPLNLCQIDKTPSEDSIVNCSFHHSREGCPLQIPIYQESILDLSLFHGVVYQF